MSEFLGGTRTATKAKVGVLRHHIGGIQKQAYLPSCMLFIGTVTFIRMITNIDQIINIDYLKQRTTIKLIVPERR